MANIKDLLGEKWKEGMSNDDIVASLNDIELPQDHTDELERLKNAVSKANSEVADYKRKLKERMSEEEKRVQEEADRIKAIETENKDLKKRILVSDYKSKFMASGMDEESALKSAEAAFSGDLDTVIANYNSRIASVEAEVKANLIDSTPTLQGGGAKQVKDYTNDINNSIVGGDFATAAALTRVAQTQNTNNE